ncbi:MAG: peptidase M24A [Puniceicoccaceae bacterium 5H]|nr:MAG: peptidase M24A [Puniceicoccaceae bacterium 5H]
MLLVLSSGANVAMAQATTDDDEDTSNQASTVPAEEQVFELDEYVVQGIRESMVKAVEIKRGTYQMVDAIVAEDLGKFPDNNLVEALQRVSGVQVTDRGAGEVSTVSIRGLNDVTTTINGRNIFTASGRSVALADIPASLLNRVDVFKTRSAEQIETGIAGVIDIRTQRPFNFDGSQVSVSARGIYQEQSDEIDPNISALFSNVWETKAGKFGALVNISYAETHYRDQSVTPGALVPFLTADAPDGWVPYERIFLSDDRVEEDPIWQAGLEAGLPFDEGSTLTMNGEPVEYLLSRDAIFASDFTGKRERPAANISLQWAPNDWSEYVVEAFYNGYRNESYNSLLFSFADWWGDLGDDPTVVTYPGTNVVKERVVGSPYGFTSGDLTTGETDSYLYAIGGKWELGENLQLESEFTYQTSEYNTDFFAMRFEKVYESLIVDFNADDGLPAYRFGDNPDTPDVDESDQTDPGQWTIAQLYDNANQSKGDAWTYTLDGDYQLDWNIFQTLSFGVRYDDRNASESERTQDAGVLGQNLADHPELFLTNEDFFDGEADVPDSWASADGYYIRGHAAEIRDLYNNTIDAGLATGDDLQLVENFNVQEATTSAYVQMDYATSVSGHTIDGQFGVRYVSVDTEMEFGDSGADTSTSKPLPSAMIRFGITDNLRLRVSYGETLRRPAFSQLNPNITYVEDVTNIGYGTATGGNPDLDPVESKNYDISLEYYFGNANAVYATAFRRDIDGLITDFRRRVTYEDYDYILTQPDNASNGKLEGFEFGLIYFPENLPWLLDGFGVQASYTILDSSQDIPITNDAGEVTGTDTTPMFGVSDTSYSIALAYEREKFSGRLAYVWRDDFLNNYEAAQFANPLGVYRKAEKSLDLQLTYNVTDSWSITFDATNLTNEIFQSYYEYPEYFNFGNSLYSRTFALGTRFSF